MRRKIILLVVLTASVLAGYWLYEGVQPSLNPKGKEKRGQELELARYDFDNLKKRGGTGSSIEVLGEPEGVVERRDVLDNKWRTGFEEKGIESRKIKFISEGKTISGFMNYFPAQSSIKPAIIMVRGYADKPGYYVGSGSWRAADELAKAGYVTVSLDFLGYGESDGESLDMLEARFEKVVAVMDLLESVKKLPFVDPNRIGFWAHSNGGQITLSVLEVTGGNYPTSLWAPMTNPFPQSVLETIDNPENSPVRLAIEDFGKKYDFRRFAFENYYSWVNSPVVIHQGTADEWCKVEWQQEVVASLQRLGKNARLWVYEGDNHNLSRNWEEVVKRDVEHFRAYFE